jgi:hypothetical protein
MHEKSGDVDGVVVVHSLFFCGGLDTGRTSIFVRRKRAAFCNSRGIAHSANYARLFFIGNQPQNIFGRDNGQKLAQLVDGKAVAFS